MQHFTQTERKMTDRFATRRNIAICQATQSPHGLQTNVKKVIAWMKKAAEQGADIALFGELFLTENNASDSSMQKAVTAIQTAAKELGIAVICGYLETADNGRYYNSLMFVDSNGLKLANYRKVHLWASEKELYTAGSSVTVVDWDGLRVGLSISVDICMPEFVGTMVANGGAQLVVNANAVVNEKYPMMVSPARALENGCYVAHVDLAGESCLGMSRVYDPLADCLVSAKTNDEMLLTATIPLYVEKAHQAYNVLRRTELYNNVIAYDTELPWKRNTAESVQHFFKNRAQYYDRQMEGVYKGPNVAASALASFIREKENSSVLDVAAGTGLVGQAMFNEGFRNLIALDRSPAMLQCLAQKQVYNKIIQGDFEEEAQKISDGSFHACICVGAFLTGGFLNPVVAAKEMIRMVEPKGFVLLLWNITELEESQCKETRENLENVIDTIVKSGKCELVQSTKVPQYLEECIGQLVVVKKL